MIKRIVSYLFRSRIMHRQFYRSLLDKQKIGQQIQLAFFVSIDPS